MTKRLHIYILKEIIPVFFSALLVFTFILLIDKLLKLTGLVINKGVAFGAVIKLFAYLSPSLLVITIPMALLIAILFAFARFSSDSEIIAMKSCGVSLYNIFPPVISFAALMYVVTLLLMIFLMPKGNSRFKESIYDILKSRLDVGLKERVLNDDFKNIVIFVDKIDKETGKLYGVIIANTYDLKASHTIFAKSGSLYTSKEEMSAMIVLNDGSIHKKVGDEEYHIVSFKDYQLKLAMNKQGAQGKAAKSKREMTLSELSDRIRKIDATGGDSNNERVEYHKKFALPFACIVFGIIATPLGIFSKRSGKSKGFTTGVAVILLYYVLLTFGESIGKRGVLPPAISVWMPNIVIGAAGVYIFIKSANESPVWFLEFINNTCETIETFIKKSIKKYL